MNKKNLLALPLIALLLTGCKDKVGELYAGSAYASGNFVENYYETWNQDLNDNVSSTVTYEMPYETDENGNQKTGGAYTNVDSKQKNASGVNPSLTYIAAADQFNSSTGEYLDWYHDTPVEDEGVGYGPTKNLSNIDKSFAYGYLSKLYDGRIQCDGYYAKSRVQLSDKGYGASFPKQLESAKYIALSLRGGTTCERIFNPVTVTFSLSLYSYDFNSKSYTRNLYHMTNVPVVTNSSGHTELVSFYFANTSLGHIPENVTAMSLTYEITDLNNSYDNVTTDVDEYKENEEKSLFAIMLYEVLIPDSSWR